MRRRGKKAIGVSAFFRERCSEPLYGEMEYWRIASQAGKNAGITPLPQYRNAPILHSPSPVSL
jgi:hypothetical protein